MEGKISALFEKIKDYRSDQGLMSVDIIREWVEQFNEGDREFILDETTHIMKHRYLSQNNAKELLKSRGNYILLGTKGEYITRQPPALKTYLPFLLDFWSFTRAFIAPLKLPLIFRNALLTSVAQ